MDFTTKEKIYHKLKINMSIMKKYRLYVISLCLIVCSVLVYEFVWPFVYSWILFQILCASDLRQSQKYYADILAGRRSAVAIAASDISVPGGESGKWASYILFNSKYPKKVRETLTPMVNDPHARISVRMEAAWILCQDYPTKKNLQELYDLVRKPGKPLVTGFMRSNIIGDYMIFTPSVAERIIDPSSVMPLTYSQYERVFKAVIKGDQKDIDNLKGKIQIGKNRKK